MPTITFIEKVEEPTPQPKPKTEPPRMFVETDVSQVTGEKPKEAPFYSDRSTVAANPVNPTKKTGETPYLDGKETRMTSTVTVVPGPPAVPAVLPAPPKPVVPPQPKPQPKVEPPKTVAEVGEKKSEPVKIVEPVKPVEVTKVAMGPKPELIPLPERSVMMAKPAVGTGDTREIGARKSRLTAVGVSRTGVAAFNVAESPFGAYDKEIIRAVQSRWYALIDQNALFEHSGVVRLTFNLTTDGAVKDLKTDENSAGEILKLFCEKAIVDSAPFKPLPQELRQLIGTEAREVNFTFYY